MSTFLRGTCRLAVVDDDARELEYIRATLRTVGSTDVSLMIEEFTDAGVVVDRIRESPVDELPWDIVLADVLMPRVTDGAFRIAEAIANRFGTDSPIKLAAITNKPGKQAAIPYLRSFDTKEYAEWFFFFVKGSPTGGLGGDTHLLDAQTWRQALRYLLVFWRSDLWGWGPIRRLEREDLSRSIFYSAKAQALLTKAIDVARNRKITCVHLSGESGTGKEIVAHMLHTHRTAVCNTRGSLIDFNCGEEQGDLLSSTIFGHYKGAYTGANTNRTGLLESAAGGTIFLDEIHQLAPSDQKKLLRVIETGRIPKLGYSDAAGSRTPRPAFKGVLVVTASTSPLGDLVGEQLVHPHLANRLGKSTIHVPPLRERREDIVPAALLFLREIVAGVPENANAEPSIDQDGQDWLRDRSHRWPGNFRQISDIVTAASRNGTKAALTREDFEEATCDDLDFRPSPERTAARHAPNRTVGSLTRDDVLSALQQGGIENQADLLRALFPELRANQIRNLKPAMKQKLLRLVENDAELEKLVAPVLAARRGRPRGR